MFAVEHIEKVLMWVSSSVLSEMKHLMPVRAENLNWRYTFRNNISRAQLRAVDFALRKQKCFRQMRLFGIRCNQLQDKID